MDVKKPEIKLLCPPKKCGKCCRMISRMEAILKELGISEEIQIINDLEEMQKYPTWILPTLIINGKVAARGYIPSKDAVKEMLTKK